MRRTIAATAALLLATLTACGSSNSDDKPAKPSASATSSPTAKAYTYDDCVELLEYDYQQGESKDASGDPECSHLTSDEYTKAVGEVLAGHRDEIMDKAAREVLWDATWEEMAASNREGMCAHIQESGVEVVGQALDDAGDVLADHGVEMAEYLRDNKC